MTKKAKTPAEVKTAEVKTTAVEVKEAVAEAPAKKAEKKPAAKRAARLKTSVVLQFQGAELTEADLVAQAKKLWAETGRTEAIKELNLYVKPEDGAVYCVVNGETVGHFAL